jgi:hypothetical protein
MGKDDTKEPVRTQLNGWGQGTARGDQLALDLGAKTTMKGLNSPLEFCKGQQAYPLNPTRKPLGGRAGDRDEGICPGLDSTFT